MASAPGPWPQHNYLLDVTVRGQIDPRSGMVSNLAALQKLLDDEVLEPFDHTFLNKDVPFFSLRANGETCPTHR